MLPVELEKLVSALRENQVDPQVVACVPAHDGAPEEIYDLISAFANQDEGGVIVFGVDDQEGCEPVGVYAVLDLQQEVVDQCGQMTPLVDPVFTVAVIEGKRVVAAEIPATEMAPRPCYYAGKGVELGSFKRASCTVEPLSAYELYSFTADAQRIHDDVRPLPDVASEALDPDLISSYLDRLHSSHPSLASLNDSQALALVGLECSDGTPTPAGLLLFGRYPQASRGQLCIVASRIVETTDDDGFSTETLTDTARIEGTIPEMLQAAVDYALGTPDGEAQPGDETCCADIPREALCQAILNALEHRDYSVYTESIPVQLAVRTDSVEVVNPGGLFGSTRAEQLGTSWCDQRNTTLAAALVTLGVAAGNQSGLTAMAEAMEEAGCPEPEIWCNRTNFSVTLRAAELAAPAYDLNDDTQKMLAFCTTPRSRAEIAELFGLSSVAYVTNHYIMPAVEKGLLSMSLPDKPRSKNQRYTTV